jgi:ribosomal-protein-serine acetyltransferase
MNPLLIDVPGRLETARLVMRLPEAGDGALIYPAARESLPELKPWMVWATDDYSEKDAEEWCRRAAARALLREQLAYLIFLRDGGSHLGNVSAFEFDWKVGKCEIGYWLSMPYCGHGYMAEAVGALVLMLQSLSIQRIRICMDARNIKSRRVAERAGFELEGILRSDFLAVNGELGDRCVYARILQRAS